MKNIKSIIIAVLLGITIVCVYKYFVSVKENNNLSTNVQQLNTEIGALENEKDELAKGLIREKELSSALDQQNTGLKANLTQNQEKLTKMETDFQTSQKVIEELNAQFSLVKVENTALRDQIQELELNINQVKVDKEELQSRLSSIVELKKAIKELRQKTRQTKKEVQNRIELKEKIFLGNNGFLLKNGKSTFGGKVKIEVMPLPGN